MHSKGMQGAPSPGVIPLRDCNVTLAISLTRIRANAILMRFAGLTKKRPYCSGRLLDRSLNRRRQQLRPSPPVYRLVEQDVYKGSIPGSRDGSSYKHVIFANGPFHRLHRQPASQSAGWLTPGKRKSIANVNVLWGMEWNLWLLQVVGSSIKFKFHQTIAVQVRATFDDGLIVGMYQFITQHISTISQQTLCTK